MKTVLFVCTHNAGRSQMAEAFFNRFAPPDLRATSAGSHPGREVWPAVVQAMSEEDLDLGGRRPVKLSRELQLQADWAVTLGCGDACPYVATTVEDWDVADPAGKPLAEVRAIRDEIKVGILDLLDHRADAIRADRTAHQIRLTQLLRMLEGQVDAERSPHEIRACADAVLQRYDGARVRSFTMTLAYRDARSCLAQERCEVLAGTV